MTKRNIFFSKKTKLYYIIEPTNCESCLFLCRVSVLIQIGKKMLFYCDKCKKEFNKNETLKHHIVAMVIEPGKLPKDVIVIQDWKFQMRATEFTNAEAVKIPSDMTIDNTKYSGMESIKGATIGQMPTKLLKEQEKEVTDIDGFMLGIKESKPIIEHKAKKLLE